MPNKMSKTSAIQRYIQTHPEMQKANVPLAYMERCAFYCSCTTYEVMVVLQLGSLQEEGNMKEYVLYEGRKYEVYYLRYDERSQHFIYYTVGGPFDETDNIEIVFE